MNNRDNELCNICKHEHTFHRVFWGCMKDIHSSTTFGSTRTCGCSGFNEKPTIEIVGVDL